MKLLFVDVDGVLNGHESVHGCCIIQPRCVPPLNRIVAETDCKLVISSSWRYMVHNGSMTLLGFEYMLRTHGINAAGRLHGVTKLDEDSQPKREPDNPDDYSQRSWQIHDYMKRHCPAWHCVLDDGQLYSSFQVRTVGNIGLTEADADAVIKILGKIP